MAYLKTIKYNDWEIKKWEADDGFCCYEAFTIANILKITNISTSICNFSDDETVSKEDRSRYTIYTYKKYGNSYRKDNQITLITEKGLKRLLCKCRSPASVDLARFLGLDVYSYKPHIKETTYINSIMKALKGEQFLLQYNPEGTKYRIDAYMPKYNIAIECDERKHDYQQDEDITRQVEITKILNCTWVRFRSDNPDFDIFDVIGGLYKMIMEKQTKV